MLFRIYFPFSDELKSEKKNEIASDQVDANPNSVESATSSPYNEPQCDITTAQSMDTSTKREKRENQFRYKMNYPQRGCFIIFNHEVCTVYSRKIVGFLMKFVTGFCLFVTNLSAVHLVLFTNTATKRNSNTLTNSKVFLSYAFEKKSCHCKCEFRATF